MIEKLAQDFSQDDEDMSDWTIPYVGKAWSPEYDCASLVVQVERDVFKKPTVTLPTGMDWKRTKPSEILVLNEDRAEAVDDPKEGDVVLMKFQGNRMSLGHHVGVYAWRDGQGWCLHNVEGIGVLFNPLAHLGRLALEVVGCYRLRDA